MLRFLRKTLRAVGLDVVRYAPEPEKFPTDATADEIEILKSIEGFTMTGLARQISLIRITKYLAEIQLSGSFVECGVWRGGSSMAIALALLQSGDSERDLYLYDTYEGMTPPTDADKIADGTSAVDLLKNPLHEVTAKCIADLNDVRINMNSTKYPQEKMHFVKGPVEQTIPEHSPKGKIALLRLDTDWYESTRHELEYLFPMLQEGGVMILDDYGHWEGARLAVDEYLAIQSKRYFLHRIDYSGRLLVK